MPDRSASISTTASLPTTKPEPTSPASFATSTKRNSLLRSPPHPSPPPPSQVRSRSLWGAELASPKNVRTVPPPRGCPALSPRWLQEQAGILISTYGLDTASTTGQNF